MRSLFITYFSESIIFYKKYFLPRKDIYNNIQNRFAEMINTGVRLELSDLSRLRRGERPNEGRIVTYAGWHTREGWNSEPYRILYQDGLGQHADGQVYHGYPNCGLSGKQRKKPIEEAMEQVGMTNRLRHYPGQLSGGQQQRVAIARALAGKPPVLLADEPTGNLDSAMGGEIMELIRSLHGEGSTVIMVTHDQRFVDLAQRVVRLFDGRLADEAGATGTVPETA